MEVFKAIRKRYSVRGYLDKQVEDDKLNKVLEAARLAPSARNIQEWKFVVVKDKDTRQKMIDACKGQEFVGQAPVIIVACAIITDYTMTCGQLAYPVDLSIAVDHMTLQAVELGLGTCWIGAFFEDKVKKLLKIPDEARIVAVLPLGYPSTTPKEKQRKPLDQIICYDKWC